MTTLNIETFKAYEQVLTYGKPFYASDFDFCGGIISALSTYGLIQPTGNTKEYFIPVHNEWGGDDLYRKTTVKEWECTVLAKNPIRTGNREYCVEQVVRDYRKFIEMFDRICEIERAMLRD